MNQVQFAYLIHTPLTIHLEYFFKNEVILIFSSYPTSPPNMCLKYFSWSKFSGNFLFPHFELFVFLENLSPYTSVLGVLTKRKKYNHSGGLDYFSFQSRSHPMLNSIFKKKVNIWNMNMHRWRSFQRRWSLPSFQFLHQILLGLVAVIGIFLPVSRTGFPDRFCLSTIFHQFFIDIIQKSHRFAIFHIDLV